jgi:hypothetical protein
MSHHKSFKSTKVVVCYLTMLSVQGTYSINDRMINECGAIGGMRTNKGDRSTQRKPTPVTLCPTQILHDLTWDQTKVTTMGSQQLTV